jgi:ABC-type Na+ efflux pump permease subunit
MTADVPIKQLQIKHRIFSPARITAIASNTLLELVRLKVFYFLLIFALLIIGCSGFMSIIKLQDQEEFQILKDVALGAMSVFSILLCVLATAMMLPKDIEDRTLYTILAKPVPRFEYLLGKLFGVFALLAISVIVMSAMFALALWLKERSLLNDVMHGPYASNPEIIQAQIASVKAQGFTVSLIPCIIIIYLKSAIFAALTLLVSTFASSSIFTIFVSFTAYFIGMGEVIAREYFSRPSTRR